MKKSSIPNIFTFINLSCGIISILSTFKFDYLWASIFILLAGLVDRYDGRIARHLNVTSEVGKELDSLADLVSFGVAPSILMYIIYNLSEYGPFGLVGLSVLLLLPICGAFRLARYNISSFDGVFTGVPITIVGCFLAIVVLVTINISIPTIIPVLLMAVCSYLMVSNMKLKKL